MVKVNRTFGEEPNKRIHMFNNIIVRFGSIAARNTIDSVVGIGENVDFVAIRAVISLDRFQRAPNSPDSANLVGPFTKVIF
jgi:hypothetical protein